MRFTFIDNACGIVEHDGFRILSDPWLSEGAFDGSWYHFPPLRTTPQELCAVDAIYVSHIHPDHFDQATLAVLPHDLPVIVLDQGKNYLHRALAAAGFDRLVKIPDGKSAQLGPFALTAYKPFATDIFHESTIGNVIDSSLAMEAGQYKLYNGNDNNLTLEAAEAMRRRHGTFDLALLKYNAASPYPACFFNLDEQRRLAEAARIRERNLEHLVRVTEILQPRCMMPFAGNFVYAGKQWPKNRFLGTTTWDAAAQYVAQHLPAQKMLVMNEGQTYDLASGTIAGSAYKPVDRNAQDKYAEGLADVTYPYESETLDEDARARMRSALPIARANLWRMQQQLGFTQAYNMYVDVADGEYFHFSFADAASGFAASDAPCKRPYLRAAMDPRLLLQILERRAHWNNVEIGGHIDFFRDPDVYYPDVHVMLSFLHVPQRVAKIA